MTPTRPSRFWIALGAGALVLLIICAIVVYVYTRPRATPVATGPGTSFPIASSSVVTSNVPAVITITGQNGMQLRTKNFIDNGTTIKDTVNPGNYLLAGALGYCLPGIACVAATSSEFNIFYDSNANAFTIGLLTEPLGTARLHAEVFLEQSLGLSAKDLCALNYYIGTTYRVNENYASENLGFSACPGATQLPQ